MLESHFELKIKAATEIKNQGNQEFKAKIYNSASDFYKKALTFVQPYIFHGATALEIAKAAQLRANLVFNIGFCFFNMFQWKEAEAKFTEAIAINPNYTKAFFKRALTRYELADYEGSYVDIKKAIEFESNNPEFQSALQKIQKKYPQHQKIKVQKREEPIVQNHNSSKLINKPEKANKDFEKLLKQQNQSKKKKQLSSYRGWIFGGMVLAGILLFQTIKNPRK